jgi:hypothetical protein
MNNNVMQELANMINYARRFQSPQAFMNALQRQNPQAAQQLIELSKNISNPYAYAMQRLQEQGISPQAFLQMLNQR